MTLSGMRSVSSVWRISPVAVSRSRVVPRTQDRADASPCGERGPEPVVVVVAGGSLEQLGIECPGARPISRRRVSEDGKQGQRRDSHALLTARGLRRLIADGADAVSAWVRTGQLTWQAWHW